MLLAIIKILNMLYPFIKEAYLTKNKYKRNKTLITLTVVIIIMLLFMTASIDTTYTLYKQNKTHEAEMVKLKEEFGTKTDRCEALTKSIAELDKKITELAEKQKRR